MQEILKKTSRYISRYGTTKCMVTSQGNAYLTDNWHQTKSQKKEAEKKAKSQSNKSPGSKASQVAGETATVHSENERRPNFVCREQRPPQWDEILFNLGNIHVLRKQVFGFFDPPPLVIKSKHLS